MTSIVANEEIVNCDVDYDEVDCDEEGKYYNGEWMTDRDGFWQECSDLELNPYVHSFRYMLVTKSVCSDIHIGIGREANWCTPPCTTFEVWEAEGATSKKEAIEWFYDVIPAGWFIGKYGDKPAHMTVNGKVKAVSGREHNYDFPDTDVFPEGYTVSYSIMDVIKEPVYFSVDKRDKWGPYHWECNNSSGCCCLEYSSPEEYEAEQA